MKASYQKQPAGAEAPVPENRPVQVCLPIAEALLALEQGLGELIRRVGRLFVESMLEAEVEQVAGPRSRNNPARQAYRWGLNGVTAWSMASACPFAARAFVSRMGPNSRSARMRSFSTRR